MPLDAKLLATVPTLSPAELDRLEGAIRAARGLGGAAGGGSPSPAGITGDAHWALATLADYARRRGNDLLGVNQLAASRNFPAFADKVPAFMEYLEPHGLSRNERTRMLLIGLELLANSLDYFKAGVNSRNLMNHFHNIPRAIENEFPGYHRARQFKLIVRTRTDANKEKKRYG